MPTVTEKFFKNIFKRKQEVKRRNENEALDFNDMAMEWRNTHSYEGVLFRIESKNQNYINR